MLDITKHEKLVHSVAKKYRCYCTVSVEYEDLVQAGNLGLLRAASDYDEARGEFSTYAVYWIREFIMTELNNNSRTVRVPRHELRKGGYAIAATQSLSTDFEAGAGPLDAEVDQSLSQFDSVAANEESDRLHRAIESCLSDTQKTVVRMRMKDCTYTVIGKELNLTRQRITQIEKKAMSILRKELQNEFDEG